MSVARTDLIVTKRGAAHYRATVEDLPRLAIPATRAVLNSAASASGLEVDTVYWITDEMRLAVANAANAYTAMAKQGEAAAGSASITQVTVNFSAASVGQFFNVAVAGAIAGQKVMASASLNMPAGVAEDELEMDPIIAYGHVKTAGQVRLFVGSANGGLLGGQRNINISLGA